MSNILVISPHPDDESIGCGGTLRRHVVSGDRVFVVFLTSGEKGGHGSAPEKTLRVREAEAASAAQILGLAGIEFWREPDGAMRVTRKLVARFREELTALHPTVVYAPHPAEAHLDHQAAVRLVRKALDSTPGKKPAVRLYEIWTPLQRMTHIEDITPYIAIKLAAIRAYKSQCKVLDFAAAAQGLARYRGEMHSWPEGEFAEVFGSFPRK